MNSNWVNNLGHTLRMQIFTILMQNEDILNEWKRSLLSSGRKMAFIFWATQQIARLSSIVFLWDSLTNIGTYNDYKKKCVW